MKLTVSIILFQDTTPSVINWQDYEGRTALHLAVADGNAAVVKALVCTHVSFVDACQVGSCSGVCDLFYRAYGRVALKYKPGHCTVIQKYCRSRFLCVGFIFVFIHGRTPSQI